MADRTSPPASGGPPGRGGSLARRYGGLVFDLDGVLYLRDQVIRAAPAAIAGVRREGVALGFVTNNSYLPPEQVAAKLARLGVPAGVEEVFTSAQAVVRLLGGERAIAGARVLLIGGPGFRGALLGAGAELVEPDDWRKAQIVAVGIDPDVRYHQLAMAALAIRAGARFVGSNPDRTLPAPEGLLPGAGSLLALLETATGVRPEVAGKPEPALLETAASAIGPGPYLMVGDRADTDLAGAVPLGWGTALVLTGVTRLADLPDLDLLPDHVLHDVAGVLEPPGPVVREATAGDADAIAKLLGDQTATPAGGAAATSAAPGATPAGGGVAAIARDQTATPAGGGAVAEGERGELVGAALWSLRHGDQGELSLVLVRPEARGRLVGTRLVMAACAALRRAGCRRVVAPAGGEGFLARLGFRQADGVLSRPLGGGVGGPAAQV